MDPAITKTFAEIERQTEKTNFIFVTVIYVFLAMVGLLFGVAPRNYPAADALSYEECTFVRYQYSRSGREEPYLIYVEEYENPLEVSAIAAPYVNAQVLSAVPKGEKIVISSKETRRENPLLICAYYNDQDILSYERYLEAHADNDRVGRICGFGLFGLLSLATVYNWARYKKTGKSLRIYSRFDPDRPTWRDLKQDLKSMARKHRAKRK